MRFTGSLVLLLAVAFAGWRHGPELLGVTGAAFLLFEAFNFYSHIGLIVRTM